MIFNQEFQTYILDNSLNVSEHQENNFTNSLFFNNTGSFTPSNESINYFSDISSNSFNSMDNSMDREMTSEDFKNAFKENTLNLTTENIKENSNQLNSYTKKFSGNYFMLSKRKKRGRKAKGENNKIHSKVDFDNLLTKIQVHFLTFLINVSNDALMTEFNGNITCNFKNLPYKTKKKVNYNFFLQLKSSKIKDVLKMDISEKYKRHDKNINKNTLIEVCDKSKWLNDFFNMKYIKLFTYYYNNLKPLEILNFGGKNIYLSNTTKSFYYLLEKNETSKTQLIHTLKSAYFNGNYFLCLDSYINGYKLIELNE